MVKMSHRLDVLFPGISEIAKAAVEWRRYIHRNPELSFLEYKTALFVENTLKESGYTNIRRIAETGVVALLHDDLHLPCIALRADLDALPIIEIQNRSYRSLNEGVMHACGHDAHTACLLGAADYLFKNRSRIPFNIKFIFQPGEEKLPGGASLLIKEGVLENPSVQEIFGIHVTPQIETGTFGVKAGAFMASTDELHIRVNGKGGHAAMVQSYINPVFAGSRFISEAMQKVQLHFPGFGNEYVLAFGHFDAKGATNVIPGDCNILGTLRTFDEDLRNAIHLLLHEIAKDISEETRAKFDLNIIQGYPVLMNDTNLTEKTKNSLVKAFGESEVIHLDRRMTAEDFAWYSQKVPACFIRWGTGNAKKGISAGVHTPEFDIDEDAMIYGIAAFLQCALNR
jgi:amidohydrolase